eukprot:GHVL01004259.1.p1 GENE.GHVL01004259.1~~GHVL01004259.1.p1  ORF type:complete len:105 (-),score=16.87 GHVL01004259.1:32-346(-)
METVVVADSVEAAIMQTADAEEGFLAGVPTAVGTTVIPFTTVVVRTAHLQACSHQLPQGKRMARNNQSSKQENNSNFHLGGVLFTRKKGSQMEQTKFVPSKIHS